MRSDRAPTDPALPILDEVRSGLVARLERRNRRRRALFGALAAALTVVVCVVLWPSVDAEEPRQLRGQQIISGDSSAGPWRLVHVATRERRCLVFVVKRQGPQDQSRSCRPGRRAPSRVTVVEHRAGGAAFVYGAISPRAKTVRVTPDYGPSKAARVSRPVVPARHADFRAWVAVFDRREAAPVKVEARDARRRVLTEVKPRVRYGG